MISNAEDCGFYERLPDRSFELIYMEHVLEHVPNPVELLNNLVRLLSSQGVLVICVPNHGCLLSRMLRLKWGWTCPPSHLYYYKQLLGQTAAELRPECFRGFRGRLLLQKHIPGSIPSPDYELGVRVLRQAHGTRCPAQRATRTGTQQRSGTSQILRPIFVLPSDTVGNYFWGGSELLVVAGKNIEEVAPVAAAKLGTPPCRTGQGATRIPPSGQRTP